MVSRYDELLAELPRGAFYTAAGRVLPYRDAPYEFLFDNGIPNTDYGVFVNGVYKTTVTTDITGTAVISVQLEQGRQDIRLENDDTGATTLLGFAEVRHTATWLASYAGVLEGLDASLDATAAANKLETAPANFIEDTHGRIVRQPNDVGIYVLDTYRHVLRQLRQAYRTWGARDAGLNQIVGAFTSSAPLRLRHEQRPQWVLGTQLAPNNDLQEHVRLLSPATPLTTINSRSRDWVRQSFASNVSVIAAQPATAKKLRVNFTGGWSINAHVQITGVLADGVTAATELFTATPGGTTPGTKTFKRITDITVLNPGPPGDTATVQTLDSLTTLFVLADPGAHPFAQPPHAQALTVTYGAGWASGDIVITGTRPGGAAVSEVFLAAPSTTVTGLELFETVTGITKPLNNPGSTATIGVTESRFVDIVNIGGLNGFSAALAYSSIGSGSMQWTAGASVPVPVSGRYVLRNAGPQPTFYGLAETPGAYAFGAASRLWLDVDNRGIMVVDVGAAPTPAAVVASINASFAADPRYGAGYNSVAALHTGVGYVADILALESPNIGLTAAVRVHAGGYGASLPAFGVPRAATTLTAPALAGATTLTVTDASALPAITGDAAWPLRVGRTERLTGVTGTITPQGASASLAVLKDVLLPLVSQAPDVGGFVNITTPGDNFGVHRIVALSGTDLLIKHEAEYHDATGAIVTSGGGLFTAAAGVAWRLEPAGEIVNVIANDGVATLTLATPGLVAPKAAGALVETLKSMPAEVVGHEGLGTLTIDVDKAFAPASSATDGPLVLQGTTIPDGWLVDNITTAAMRDAGYLTPARLHLTGAGGGDITLQRTVPRVAEDHKGFTVRTTFWVQQSSSASENFTAEISFDNGATFTTGPATAVAGTVSDANGAGSLAPTRVDVVAEVPYDAVGCIIRLRHVGSALNDVIYVEKVNVVVETTTGLFLGVNTVPRDDQHAYFGEVIYVWAPNELSSAERAAIGLPEPGAGDAPAKSGHIDYVTAAHASWSRYDVSEYDGAGVAKNLVGLYNEIEWLAATRVNLDVVVATPARLSRVVPTAVSMILGEPLVPDGLGNAVLGFTSSQPGPFSQSPSDPGARPARLYENGVPVPDTPDVTAGPDPWVWAAANSITIDGGIYNPAFVYTFDYERLIEVETGVLDLGANYADYLWLVDLAEYRRVEASVLPSRVTVQVSFLANLQALLQQRSDQNAAVSTLMKDDGSEATLVPAAAWSYIDSQTISIDAGEFDPDAIYTLEYNAQTGSYPRPASLRLEARSAALVGTVSLATYRVVQPNELVNRAHQYHQLRLRVYDVTDTRDVSIAGLGLKGVNLYGTPPNAPGLLLP